MCKVQSTKELRRAEAEGLTSLAGRKKSRVGARRRVSQRADESERTRTQNTLYYVVQAFDSVEGIETKPHRKRSRTYPVSHVRDASVVRAGHASSSTRRAVGAAALAPAAASAYEGVKGQRPCRRSPRRKRARAKARPSGATTLVGVAGQEQVGRTHRRVRRRRRGSAKRSRAAG